MHRVANINSEIQLCQRQLFALGAVESGVDKSKKFMSALVASIVEYDGMLAEISNGFRRKVKEMENNSYHKYTTVLTRRGAANGVEGLCTHLRTLENTKVESSQHLLSVYSHTDEMGLRLQAGVGILTDPVPGIVFCCYKITSVV
jgi:hypothetical protein